MKIAAIIIVLLGLTVTGFLLLRGKSSKTTTQAVKRNSSDFPPEMVERINQARAECEKVRSQDPQFFEAVSKAMFDRDPIGINFETNTDEYDSEAGTVIPRLNNCASVDDVVTVLHEEFTKWFEASAGAREKYRELAKDIWDLYKNRSHNSGNGTRGP